MKNKEFKDILNSEKSKVHEFIAFRKANKNWLNKSAQIAIAIIKVLREKKISQVDLANKVGVTPQYISKIVRGQENLTLETISKIEQVLEIKLITIESYQYHSKASMSSRQPIVFDRSKYKLVSTLSKTEERKTFYVQALDQNSLATAA